MGWHLVFCYVYLLIYLNNYKKHYFFKEDIEK